MRASANSESRKNIILAPCLPKIHRCWRLMSPTIECQSHPGWNYWKKRSRIDNKRKKKVRLTIVLNKFFWQETKIFLSI